MSIIKCPECQKEISNTSTSCPNCGCPLSNETENIICQEQQNADEQNNNSEENIIIENNKTKKHTIFCNKKFIIAMLVIFIFILSGSIFAGVKIHNMKQEAISVSYELEQWTVENLNKKYQSVFPKNSKITDVSDDTLNEIIGELQNLKKRYNSLNEYQRKYISDSAKALKLDYCIKIFEQTKELKSAMNELYQTIVDEAIGK